MSMSNYLEAAVLNHLFRGVTFTPPSNLYASLFTADPTESGIFTDECNGTDFARVAVNIAAGTTVFGSPSSGVISSSSKIQFPTPGADDWGTITHVALLDSATLGAGNFWLIAALSTPLPVFEGDDVNIPVAAMFVTGE